MILFFPSTSQKQISDVSFKPHGALMKELWSCSHSLTVDLEHDSSCLTLGELNSPILQNLLDFSQ